MDQDKINILRIFQLDGTPVSCEDYGSGHVNVTFLVVTDTGRRYILQKINHHAFRNVQALSENIAAVTDFLRSKSSDPRSGRRTVRPTPGMGTNTGAYTIMWTGRSAFSSRRRTRISIRPPSVSVRLRSCSLTSRRKSCTRPSRIFTTRPIAAAYSARRSSATRWAAPRPFSRRSILLLQGKRRCPFSRTFFLPERSRSALRTTTQSSTTSFWTRRHERRSALWIWTP